MYSLTVILKISQQTTFRSCLTFTSNWKIHKTLNKWVPLKLNDEGCLHSKNNLFLNHIAIYNDKYIIYHKWQHACKVLTEVAKCFLNQKVIITGCWQVGSSTNVVWNITAEMYCQEMHQELDGCLHSTLINWEGPIIFSENV